MCTLINNINFSLYAVIKYIQKKSTMNSDQQGLLSALEKPKSNPVEQVLFHSDKVNKNENISEQDERWNINDLSFITTLKVKRMLIN